MAGNVVSFSCPSCGAPVQVRAQGRSLSVVCERCRTVIDPNDPTHKILSEASAGEKRHPDIPLGTRGKFEGTPYEVVGFMIRVDQSGEYEWREYLLNNPQQGFKWLLEFDGAWCFTKPIKKPEFKNGTIQMFGKTLTPQMRDYPRVTYALGEFYWQVEIGETVQSLDYIKAPYMVSCEESSGEINWSLSTYMSPQDVKLAFAPNKLNLPAKTGTAPNEPGAGGVIGTVGTEAGNVYAYATMFSVGMFLFGIIGPVTSGSNAFTGFLAIICGAAAWIYFGS